MKIYTYDEAFQASLKYFDGNDLPARVFCDKYALRNQNDELVELTPDDMHWRLAKEFARIEKDKFKNPLTKEEIFETLKGFKRIIPQGSPMFGIGNKYQYTTISNCYVIPSPEDSYLGIMYTDTQITQISSRRGGVGWDNSKLRPKGMSVKNAAKSTTGMTSFMKRFSNTIREVCQCLIFNSLVLTKTGLKEIKDVVPGSDFVWSKEGWVKVLNKIETGEQSLYRIRTKKGFSCIATANHKFLDSNLNEKLLKDFSIGDEVVLIPGTPIQKEQITLKESTFVSTQPISISNLNDISLPTTLNESLAYLLGYSYGDGHFSTDRISLILSCNDEETIVKLKNIIKDQFKYEAKINNGSGNVKLVTIHSTKLVKWLESNDIAKEKSGEIKFPDLIVSSPSNVQLAFFAGYFDADGCAHRTGKNVRVTSISKQFIEKCQLILMANGIISNIQINNNDKNPTWNVEYRLNIQGTYSQNILRKIVPSVKINKMLRSAQQDLNLTPFTRKDLTGLKNLKKNYPYVPACSKQRLSVSVLGKLKSCDSFDQEILVLDNIESIEAFGEYKTYDLVLESEHLFWCEGFYVHNSGRRGASLQSLSVHHPEILDFINVKRDLKEITGSNITVRFTDEFLESVENNGEFELRWPVDQNIPEISNIVKSREIWDQFIDSAWKMAEPGAAFTDTIFKYSTTYPYKEFGFEETSSNPCGEQYLPPFGVCRLICINLYTYVKNKFEKNSHFDFDEFTKDVRLMQRLADDMVDLDIEAMNRIINKIKSDPEPEEVKRIGLELWQKIIKTSQQDRRTGCGLTGLGDTIAALGMRYGSDESIDFAEKMQKEFKLAAFRESVSMAEELGQFPLYDYDLDKTSQFIKDIKKDDSELYEDMKRFGRRNMTLLTIAPTGSVSCLTQTTSGIEPAFMLSYTRRKKGNPGDKDFRTDFIDPSGDHWMNFEVFHQGVKDWKAITNKEDVNESPYKDSSSHEIDYVKRVELQAKLQKHIDNSISTTVNLPNDITKEKVSEIYLMAWKLGCKGMTIYRDGSRTGVLVSEKEVVAKTSGKIVRPKELPCDVHHISVKGKPYFVLVGLYDDKPYELFAGRNGMIGKNVEKGKIIKMLRPKGYKAILEDESEICPITMACDENEESLTRMVSMSLRHGVEIRFISDQLSKVQGDMFSFAKALTRALKHYVKDGESSTEACPECKQKTLIYLEGCKRCQNCSYSGCN